VRLLTSTLPIEVRRGARPRIRLPPRPHRWNPDSPGNRPWSPAYDQGKDSGVDRSIPHNPFLW